MLPCTLLVALVLAQGACAGGDFQPGGSVATTTGGSLRGCRGLDIRWRPGSAGGGTRSSAPALCLRGGGDDGFASSSSSSWENFPPRPAGCPGDAGAQGGAGAVDGGVDPCESSRDSASGAWGAASSSESGDAEPRVHVDPAADPGDLEIDVGPGARGPWPAPKGNVGKLYDAIREHEYAQANASYAPPGGLIENFIDQLGAWSAGHYKALVVLHPTPYTLHPTPKLLNLWPKPEPKHKTKNP